MQEVKGKKWLDYFLGTIQLLIGIGAVAGGAGLISDPSGAKMDLQKGWLSGSPFPDYFIPGIMLLVVIGGGNILGSVFSYFHKKSRKDLAVFLGSFLMIYLAIEVWYIGIINASQPLTFILGMVETGIGVWSYNLIKSDQDLYASASTGKI